MPDDKSVFKTFNLYCILFKKLMAPIGHLTKTEQKANASTAAVVSLFSPLAWPTYMYSVITSNAEKSTTDLTNCQVSLN